ncbi:alpha/beta hydrolase [Pararhodobacter sp.]|uniref:alpha/beta fold hydrolase n=1 Tax=Pararhodobacter sp. TaxID=2127056 RepID=UPI002AFFDA57|nr:alpha/beta hydrolase [Pararhodobacter sp.]
MSTLPVYRTRGSGNTTIFMLHGAYGDGRYFSDLADGLAAAGYRVIDWDAPGYGESPAVEPATIETFCDAAQAMIQKEATATNVVLGHSMGSLIGPRLTNAEPKVNGLILSAGSMGVPNRSPEDRAKFLEERLAPLERGMTVQEYARPLITHMMAKGASGPLVDKVFDVVLSMRTETFRASLNALTQYNGRPALEALKKPVMMLAGEVDPACSAAGMQEMHELVGHSEFHVLPGVGHYGFAEKPAEFKAIVLDWLSRSFPAT